MSWLYTRALSALKGLHAGDGQPQAGGMLDWSLTLADWLIDRRLGPHPAHQIAEPGDRSPLPSPPDGFSKEQCAAGAGVVVGLLRRPQDHNGIVDDAVTLVAPLCDSSAEIASACALAAFLSAVVDGWDMEGAMSQTLFVAKRGETFGREKGPSVAQAIEEVLDQIYATENRIHAARSVLYPPASSRGGKPTLPVAKALGLAYLSQEPEEVHRLIGSATSDNGEATHFGRLEVGESRYLAAMATMLTAAHRPANLPQEMGQEVEERTDIAELLDDLLELRAARYQRTPHYAARFRRKKC